MSKQDLIKGFLVSYTLPNNEGKEDLKNVFVSAYSKKEAGDIFIKWAKGTKVYNQIGGIVVQEVKKHKRNKDYFTKDYYNKQLAEVNNLYAKTLN